jgi:hypothetical protein
VQPDIAAAMKAVTAALASGIITPGEAEAIARLVDTFIRAIETSDFDRRLKAIEESDVSAGAADSGWGYYTRSL